MEFILHKVFKSYVINSSQDKAQFLLEIVTMHYIQSIYILYFKYLMYFFDDIE